MKVLVLSRNAVIPQHFNADYPAFFYLESYSSAMW